METGLFVEIAVQQYFRQSELGKETIRLFEQRLVLARIL